MARHASSTLRFVFVLTGSLLGACSTNAVNLTYAPPTVFDPPAVEQATVSVGGFTDGRKHEANWLGAIRGGFGNPLKTLTTPIPVSEVVRQAFVDGLRARHLYAKDGQGRFDLTANVIQFDSNRYVRREAHAKIALSLVERASKREVLAELAEADTVEGSLVALDNGIFASVDELRDDVERTLRQVVDRFLDGPRFRQAIGLPAGG